MTGEPDPALGIPMAPSPSYGPEQVLISQMGALKEGRCSTVM